MARTRSRSTAILNGARSRAAHVWFLARHWARWADFGFHHFSESHAVRAYFRLGSPRRPAGEAESAQPSAAENSAPAATRAQAQRLDSAASRLTCSGQAFTSLVKRWPHTLLAETTGGHPEPGRDPVTSGSPQQWLQSLFRVRYHFVLSEERPSASQ